MSVTATGTLQHINRKGLKQILPHRGRALKIDGITVFRDNVSGEIVSVEAFKVIKETDLDLEGHFPDKPVYPGHCLIECAALAAAAFAKLTLNLEGLPYFRGFDKGKIKRPVVPGDHLVFQPSIVNRKGPVIVFFIKIQHLGELVAEMKITGVAKS